SSDLDQSATENHGGQNRLHHNALAQFFHQADQINGGAAESAVLFLEGHHQPAQFGKKLPVVFAVALLAADDLLSRIKVVVLADELRDTVAKHLLFFTVGKIHCCLSAKIRFVCR